MARAARLLVCAATWIAVSIAPMATVDLSGGASAWAQPAAPRGSAARTGKGAVVKKAPPKRVRAVGKATRAEIRARAAAAAAAASVGGVAGAAAQDPMSPPAPPAAEPASPAPASSPGAEPSPSPSGARPVPSGAAGQPALAAPSNNPPAAAPGKPEIPADAPTAVARLDRNEAAIGDRLTLTVTTVAAVGVPTNLPTELDLAPFEILSGDPVIEEKDLGDGKRSRSFRLEVAVYEIGDQTLPSIPVTYIGKDGRVLSRPTDPVPVKIKSLLANEPDPKLKEASTPVEVLERDLTLVFVLAGLGIALLGAFVALEVRRRWRLRDARRPAPPPRPPHEVALEKLGRLATTGMGPEADLRAFYFQLSEIMREYLGGRFGLLALEMTTEELVGELNRRAPRGLVPGEIAGWLAGTDLVKFAKLAPPPSEARGALETAIRMVESTRPRPEPTAPGGHEASSAAGSGAPVVASTPPPRAVGKDAHGG